MHLFTDVYNDHRVAAIADSRRVTIANSIKIKKQNNNYSNADKSISVLPIHYAYGALRYLIKVLSLPERFSL